MTSRFFRKEINKKANELTKERAVIYARVSTEEQMQGGFSIPAQLDLLRDYAKKNNIEVVREFVEAESAKEAGRTKFNEMLRFLKKSKAVKSILVEKTDRLYRNVADYAKVDETEYTLYFVKENKIITPESNSNDKFVHGLNVLMAKKYIDNLREETQKGRKKKIEMGYFIGQVPYGYKKLDKNTTVINEEKAPFVRRAFELYAKGDLSLEAVRKQLIAENYIYNPCTPKISKGHLAELLQNDCYTGKLRYKGKLYQGKHEAIISENLFLKAQAAFGKDNKPKTRKQHTFLYAGMLKCAICGRTITSEIKKDRLVYYHCTGNGGKCPNKSIYLREEVIDRQFNKAIQQIQIDKEIAEYLNALLQDICKDLNIMTKEKFDYLNREIEKLKTRKNRLLDLYMDNEIEKSVWIEKNKILECQLVKFENEIKAYKTAESKTINEGKKLIELAKHTYSLYSKQNIEEKRVMLKILFSNGKLKGENLSYYYNAPFSFFAKIPKSREKYAWSDSNARPTA